jgi:hypothetical protein
MNVTLVAYVPDYLVVRAIKYSVQGNSKLHDSEIGCQMPPVLTDPGYQQLPNLRTEFIQFMLV